MPHAADPTGPAASRRKTARLPRRIRIRRPTKPQCIARGESKWSACLVGLTSRSTHGIIGSTAPLHNAFSASLREPCRKCWGPIPLTPVERPDESAGRAPPSARKISLEDHLVDSLQQVPPRSSPAQSPPRSPLRSSGSGRSDDVVRPLRDDRARRLGFEVVVTIRTGPKTASPEKAARSRLVVGLLPWKFFGRRLDDGDTTDTVLLSLRLCLNRCSPARLRRVASPAWNTPSLFLPCFTRSVRRARAIEPSRIHAD